MVLQSRVSNSSELVEIMTPKYETTLINKENDDNDVIDMLENAITPKRKSTTSRNHSVAKLPQIDENKQVNKIGSSQNSLKNVLTSAMSGRGSNLQSKKSQSRLAKQNTSLLSSDASTQISNTVQLS